MAIIRHDYNYGSQGMGFLIMRLSYIATNKKKYGYSEHEKNYKEKRLKDLEIYTFMINWQPVSWLFLYTYRYPITQTKIDTVYSSASSGDGSRFYDDTLDDKLGGQKEVLG